jgi:hypothetical protein
VELAGCVAGSAANTPKESADSKIAADAILIFFIMFIL